MADFHWPEVSSQMWSRIFEGRQLAQRGNEEQKLEVTFQGVRQWTMVFSPSIRRIGRSNGRVLKFGKEMMILTL